MITTISWNAFIEQIQRRLQNDFPSQEFTVTNNEITLYVYEALGAAITAAANQAYQLTGLNALPDNFVSTFKFPTQNFTRDWDTDRYIVPLPHPPLNLLQGYSIQPPILSGQGMRSFALIAISGYNKGYALKFMKPGFGIFYEVEGSQMLITSPELELISSGLNLFVSMLSARSLTGAGTDTINVGDETLAVVFDQVVARLSQRVATARDMNNDGANKKTEA